MTRLEIISDPVCPWCYLGARQLFRALETRGASPFSIRWRPYQLDPDLPPEGRDRAGHLAEKLGGPEAVERVHARLGALAAEAGVVMNLDAITRAPNTLDAHRLLRWAEAEGAQTPVAMALFRRYWQAGEDISDPEVLASVAAEAGMDAALAARLLASDADREETRAEIDAARAMGVTGVPTFLVAGRYAVAVPMRQAEGDALVEITPPVDNPRTTPRTVPARPDGRSGATGSRRRPPRISHSDDFAEPERCAGGSLAPAGALRNPRPIRAASRKTTEVSHGFRTPPAPLRP